MENGEDLYVMFTADQLYFLVPLSRVIKVLDGAEKPEAVPVLDFSAWLGERTESEGRRYLILLEYQGGSCGIMAEGIQGVQKVDFGDWFRLDSPVISKENRFLEAVVPIAWEEGKTCLAYVIKVDELPLENGGSN